MSKKALLFSTLMGLIAVPSHSQSITEYGGTLYIPPSCLSAFMSDSVRLGGFSFQPTIEYYNGSRSLELLANTPIAYKVPESSDTEINSSAYHTWDIVQNILTIKSSARLTYPTYEDYSYY